MVGCGFWLFLRVLEGKPLPVILVKERSMRDEGRCFCDTAVTDPLSFLAGTCPSTLPANLGLTMPKLCPIRCASMCSNVLKWTIPDGRGYL